MTKIDTIFCTKCGKQCCDSLDFVGHDAYNGQKLYRVYTYCPDKKWYNFHASFIRTWETYNWGRTEIRNLVVNESGEIKN